MEHSVQGESGNGREFDARRAPLIALFGVAQMLVSGSAHADAGPPMITDDPGTVPSGRWEINVATLSGRSADVTTFELPLVDINYGAGDRLQLKFEMPWVILDPADGNTRSGAGNSLVGAKWHFFDGGEDGWQLATYPQIESTFPFARTAHGIADSGVRYLLPVEAQHAFGAFALNLEAGRWLRPAGQADSWIAGVVVSHEVRKGFTLLAEARDEAGIGFHRDELIVDFGLHLDLSDHYSLLLSAGRDVHNGFAAPNTLLTYAAIQLHL
jgi:hypothetical protein